MSNIIYVLIGLIIITTILIIIYCNRQNDTFTIPTKQFAAEGAYQGLDYPISGSENSISSIFNNFIRDINTPSTTPAITSTTPTTTQTPTLQTAGNTPEDVANSLKSNLDIITRDYFNKGIKPSIEIDNWITNLQDRLSKIQLKMIELNIHPKEELVFY